MAKFAATAAPLPPQVDHRTCSQCGSQATTNVDPLLDVDEASLYLTLPVKTLYAYRVDGRGPRGIKIGRHLRYRRSDLDAWIRSRTDGSPAA